ncbi:MAG TPA: hypothetical protein VH206_11130 [Xanthobacteraceae bacterium]|nr:hypothetical protein [Xanthobacteraceae bacterium]
MSDSVAKAIGILRLPIAMAERTMTRAKPFDIAVTWFALRFGNRLQRSQETAVEPTVFAAKLIALSLQLLEA